MENNQNSDHQCSFQFYEDAYLQDEENGNGGHQEESIIKGQGVRRLRWRRRTGCTEKEGDASDGGIIQITKIV